MLMRHPANSHDQTDRQHFGASGTSANVTSSTQQQEIALRDPEKSEGDKEKTKADASK
jgi:hypothetical protein